MADLRGVNLREAARLTPDVVRLIRGLLADREVRRRVRGRLLLLAGYLAMPFDLVPDFIPVLGYADDVLIVALVLRSVARRIGLDAIERHWPGSAEGLSTLRQLLGLR